MATLHVRNVPVDTYEALRLLAAERKSSIGAEAVRLLQRALRTDRAGVRALLEEIDASRPRARRGAPTAAALIRRDRETR
jgi:plasmid stability protein